MSTQLEVSVPDGRSGQWEISTFTLTDADVRFENMRAMLRGNRMLVCDPGTYKKLTHDQRGVVMSNTPMEVRSNMGFIQRAKGRVHVNGLGLGMVLTAILKKPEVQSVTVVEIERDVINLVAPTFAKEIEVGKLQIIHEDCYDFKPPKAQRFDAVWHDVWDEISADNKPHMTKLRRKFGRRTDWQGCWSEEMIRRES